MTNTMMNLVGDAVQCWGCPVFDRLFQIISTAAAGFYDYFSDMCLILFLAMFTVYIINAIWDNFKNNFADPFYKKTIQKVSTSQLKNLLHVVPIHSYVLEQVAEYLLW